MPWATKFIRNILDSAHTGFIWPKSRSLTPEIFKKPKSDPAPQDFSWRHYDPVICESLHPFIQWSEEIGFRSFWPSINLQTLTLLLHLMYSEYSIHIRQLNSSGQAFSDAINVVATLWPWPRWDCLGYIVLLTHVAMCVYTSVQTGVCKLSGNLLIQQEW